MNHWREYKTNKRFQDLVLKRQDVWNQEKTIYKIEYCIMREGVSFSLKSIEDIITEKQVWLLFLIYEEVDDLNYRVKLDIEVQLVAKLPEKEYGKMNVAIERFTVWMTLMNM